MARNAVSGGGFDFSLIFSNLILLGTLALAALGWFIAFIGQIVAQARGTTDVVVSTPSDRLGVLWFGIFVQLFLLLGVAAVLASDGIAVHRLQLSAWTAVALVFAVIGIDKGIYSDYRQNGGLHAMAAGYFLLTIANVIWLFFFTAEEDSAVYALLSSLGSGGLSGPGGRAGGRAMRGGGNGSLSGGAISGPTGTSGFGTGFAAGSSSGGGYTQTYNNPSTGDITQGVAAPSAAMKSSHSLRSNTQSNAPGRVAGAAAGAPQSDFGAQSSHHQPTVPGSPASSRPAGTVEGEPTPGYGYRARALYAYQANADDPTEISFSKGEILDIVDNSGKWWQARKPTGETGIVPSNYMQLL